MRQDRHFRKNSLRLKEYDYSSVGHYFITICSKNREELFGRIAGDKMLRNDFGIAVYRGWVDLPNHYQCTLDAFIVMPNHVHGIIVLPEKHDRVGAGYNPPLRDVKHHGISEIVRNFKTFSARAVNKIRHTPGAQLWQRGFYDHIIRDEEGLEKIREYVQHNPANWQGDRNKPGGIFF